MDEALQSWIPINAFPVPADRIVFELPFVSSDQSIALAVVSYDATGGSGRANSFINATARAVSRADVERGLAALETSQKRPLNDVDGLLKDSLSLLQLERIGSVGQGRAGLHVGPGARASGE